jgi:hypothetical protein
MLEHYSHIRLDAKRQAVEAQSQMGKASGHVTNHVTNGVAEDLPETANPGKDWSGREDLNSDPPVPNQIPELVEIGRILLIVID